jgi:hypothetical protein
MGFTQPEAAGGGGSTFEKKSISLTTSDVVASGGGEDIVQIKPGAGKIWEITGLSIRIPSIGGAASIHSFKVYPTNREDTTHDYFLFANGNATTELRADMQEGLVGGAQESPSDYVEQFEIMAHVMWASNSEPLDIIYINNADANQTGERIVVVTVKEYTETT